MNGKEVIDIIDFSLPPRPIKKQESEPLTWKFWQKRRYVVVMLAFLGYFTSYSLRVNLSIAMVAMTNGERTLKIDEADGRDYNWSSPEKGIIFSSFFWGYILTQFIGGIFAKRFGGHLIFGFGIGVPAVLTILTPWLGTSVNSMIAIRVLQGLFNGVTFPCIHDIWLYWAPIPERSRMASITYAGMYIGTVVTMMTSGLLVNSFGWESIFYVFGGLGVLWHIVWMLVVRSAPHKDRFISDDELQYIEGTVNIEKKDENRFPWKSLLTSKPVYAIIAAQFGTTWAYNTMLNQMPTFLSDIFNYDIESSGFLSAAPYLTMGILVSVAGYLGDVFTHKRILTITKTRKSFICGALVIQTTCMIIAGFLIDPLWSVILIIVGVGVGGFTTSGFTTNALDIAPAFASVILGLSNTFACLTGIVSPILTGYLAKNKTVDEWRNVFYIAAGLYIVGGIIYAFWGSGRILPWSRTKKRSEVQQRY